MEFEEIDTEADYRIRKIKRKYWYHTVIYYCPICGRERKYRERIYTTKPEDKRNRSEIREVYDYCEEKSEFIQKHNIST